MGSHLVDTLMRDGHEVCVNDLTMVFHYCDL